ncbi:MAG: hypothetical protein IJ112_06350 [Oscillospiraceae bacterium]|nr:hypothetical protein [Oscillospiraceae bacterium]
MKIRLLSTDVGGADPPGVRQQIQKLHFRAQTIQGLSALQIFSTVFRSFSYQMIGGFAESGRLLFVVFLELFVSHENFIKFSILPMKSGEFCPRCRSPPPPIKFSKNLIGGTYLAETEIQLCPE